MTPLPSPTGVIRWHLARVVAAGLPHHVTQRGNRRPPAFFGDDDYALYRGLPAEGCRATPLLALAPDWRDLLAEELSDADGKAIRAGERTGRPLRPARVPSVLRVHTGPSPCSGVIRHNGREPEKHFIYFSWLGFEARG